MKSIIFRKVFSGVLFLSIISFVGGLNAFAWTITADFEQGTVGQLAGGPSGLSEPYSQTIFSDTIVHTGTRSAKTSFSQGSTGSSQYGGGITFPSNLVSGNELWARGYFYFEPGFSFTCSPVIKIFRIARVKTAGGSHGGYLSVMSNSSGEILLSNEVDNDGIRAEYKTGVNFTVGAWQSIEMYAKLSTTNPILRIWKDGILIIEKTDYNTLGNSTDVADFGLLYTYWNGGSPKNQVAYNDDIVFTTEQPTNRDAKGNYMIGSMGWPPPSKPTNLIVR